MKKNRKILSTIFVNTIILSFLMNFASGSQLGYNITLDSSEIPVPEPFAATFDDPFGNLKFVKLHWNHTEGIDHYNVYINDTFDEKIEANEKVLFQGTGLAGVSFSGNSTTNIISLSNNLS